jgi:chemotaxis protein methyltransferase CheR
MGDALGQLAKAGAEAVTTEEFAKFSEFFYRHTGIMFNEQKRYFVERRILDRIRSTGSEGFRDYFGFVRFQTSGAERQLLVNAMTVNETYFLREDYQFVALAEGVLPLLARGRRPSEPLRIWSVPCSTGEEPYSIAITILERWEQADAHDIQIMASDIDSQVLEQARAGAYGARSLHRLGPDLRERYFRRLQDGRFQLQDAIRDSIDFSTANVVDPRAMQRYRGIDVIFCRNLLIYFDDLSRRQTVEAFYECLVPGGFIFLGHSESMSRMSSLFRPCKFGDAVVYRKPLDDE